jgi:ABC-type iron transport system FetAB ATPase subunit
MPAAAAHAPTSTAAAAALLPHCCCCCQVYPGEIWFLRGPSGVGKTLLLRAVACLDPLEVMHILLLLCPYGVGEGLLISHAAPTETEA